MALSISGRVDISGRVAASELIIPPTWSWTQAGNTSAWSIAGDTATSVVSGDGTQVLHGPLLPAGNYADVYLQTGYGSYVGFLGLDDTYGSYPYNTGSKYIAWYYSGSIIKDGSNIGSAPSNLTGAQRYRIASLSGGIVKMSKVSTDGTTLQGSVLSGTMTSGYNAANLHVVLIVQNTYPVPSIQGYSVQSGSGGL